MKKQQIIKCLVLFLVLIMAGVNAEPDDKELFMGISSLESRVRPNVMVLFDSSGSMNTIIFYPLNGLDGEEGTSDDGYDPTVSYSGTVEDLNNSTNYFDDDAAGWYARWVENGNAYNYSTGELENINGKNHWTGCYEGDGTPNNFRVGGYGASYFEVGDRIIFRDTAEPYNSAIATIKSKYDKNSDGNTWFELEDIVGGPITVEGGHFQRKPANRDRYPVISYIYGTLDHNQAVRIPRNYLRWLFIHATDEIRTVTSHYYQYATFDVNVIPDPALSTCATPGNNDLTKPGARIQKLFTRIQVAREVICNVATWSRDFVKLGVTRFNNNEGGTVVEGLGDMSDENSFVSYRNTVWGLYGNSWTPLAETMANIWYYFKPGPNSKTYWPVDYEIDNGTVNHPTANPVGPMDWWCQQNFVVVMTDGESTKDRFDSAYSGSIFKTMPVKRSEPWSDWSDGWGDGDLNEAYNGIPSGYSGSSSYCPNYTCWSTSNGSDYLDDIAYFMRNQDMYPDSHFGDDPEDGWPGDQNILTYTIGFAIANDLLKQAALNGDGAYFTANNYEELVEAFKQVITSINLRTYAFSAITAPKRSTSALDEEMTASYVGYFLPSASDPVWEGHLLAYELVDLYGYDIDGSGDIGPEEYIYNTERDCQLASGTEPCDRWLYVDLSHKWDVAEKLPLDRKLYALTPDDPQNPATGDVDMTRLSTANVSILKPFFGAADDTESQQIIDKISAPYLGDVFHSDVKFVGSPPSYKKYLRNINPASETGETFYEYWKDNQTRDKVLYFGSNDGILHMVHAGGNLAGEEIWGFIPDEVLPTLRDIVIGSEHHYTVDGRITYGDIYLSAETQQKWASILVFGLRRGGNAFYALDVTDVDVEGKPKLLWKFNDPTYSGQSWAQPIIERIQIKDPTDSDKILYKWVVFLTGGFAFNNENPTDQKGKAVFVVDAENGELLWMIGYDALAGAEASEATTYIDVKSTDDKRYLTADDSFNFSVPSALSVVDLDSNGLIDTLYFGNSGGYLYKASIGSADTAQWSTSMVYKHNITTMASARITDISNVDEYIKNITVQNANSFEIGYPVRGLTSNAEGYITNIANKVLSVKVDAGTFEDNETLVIRTYQPIFHSPSVVFDICYRLWVSFGTGDRDRPRSNPTNGSFVMLRDNYSYENEKDTDLTELVWVNDVISASSMGETANNGYYFDFPDTGEKLFDPSPFAVPYGNKVALIFNTYAPPVEEVRNNVNPCNGPSEGNMMVYQLHLSCGLTDTAEGARNAGRVAGGGMHAGKEFVLYEGTDGQVASVPGGDSGGELGAKPRAIEQGSILFLKERKR